MKLWKKKVEKQNVNAEGNLTAIEQFANDFRPTLEADLISIRPEFKGSDQLKAIMSDIFQLMANAPLVMHDLDAAEKHYGIPKDSIVAYLERYAEQDDELLTIIDKEYERLIKAHGQKDSQAIMKGIDEYVRNAVAVLVK